MPLPKPRSNWSGGDIGTLHNSWQATMRILSEKTPILSEKYNLCLKRGNEAIIDKMIEMIVNETFVKKQTFYNWYSLYWKDVPHFMAKFLQQLETVFTGDTEIKIRKKMLAPAVGVATSADGMATSAVGTVPVPNPTKDWNETDINILYKECESAMSLLEKNPARISEKYKQCLQRGRDVIMKNMMEIIMDPENFPKESNSSEYLVDWQRSPEALAMILHRSETVFRRDKELQIRNKTIAMPLRESLVALVERPELRQKWGILRTYGEMKSFSAHDKFHLEVLEGKRILNEKWVEEEESYNLSEEAKAMLCLHLWWLMKYVGFSKPETIWEGIRKGWSECVSWKQGTFWKTIGAEAEQRGLEIILAAHKDIERYFKEDSEHSL
jgi:hypothetical protein